MDDLHQKLDEWDRQHVWHAFTQMAEYEPLSILSAEGCELITQDGRRLLDGVSSLWCNVHGHGHHHINAVIREQLDRVAHVTSLGMSNPTTTRLAHELVEMTPAGLEHVFFASDGTSAVEVALKMAFQYWRQCENPQPNRSKYLAFGDAYHGDTLGSVSVGGVARFHDMFEPLLFDVLRLPTPNPYRLLEGVSADELTPHFLGLIEEVLRANQNELAAVVIEPLVQAAAGMIVHPPGLLSGIRELTRKYDVFLIADEVAVGFGRTGRMFACEWENVEPDFLCLGKGLTGGYLPMSATLATTRVWNAFLGTHAESKTFFHGHSFSGNPLCASAALANLEVFEREDTLWNLQPKIDRLSEHLQRIAALPYVGNARQCGFMAGIELVVDKVSKTPFPWEERRGQQICDFAMQHGVWLRPLGNVVVIMPPLSISLEQLDRICEVVYEGIASMSEVAARG